MIQIGCLARFFNPYKEEVEFAKAHGFDFMQLWYDKNGLALNMDSYPKEKIIKEQGFPTIIHAVLDVNEFEEHVPKVIELLEYLDQKEVIIHPICESEPITGETNAKLSAKVEIALDKLSAKGIRLYLENNSRLDPMFHTPDELKMVFDNNPGLELLLDVAHINSYGHLKAILEVKSPKALHVADKHFDVIHEHLPIGQGEIDYAYVLRELLKDFDGKVILEVIQSDEEIIHSRQVIKENLDLK